MGTLRCALFSLLVGCLGPVPQAADDGGGGEGPITTANGRGGNTTVDGGGGGTTTDGGGGSTTSEGGGGSPPGELTLGGSLHFLQGSEVTLENGSETLTLDENGTFTFEDPLGDGEGYDVTVTASPPGQTCWVQNGVGTARANVTDIDVRCTTILQRKTPSPGSQESTTSTTPVPIPNLQSITFTTDIAAEVMATLLIPKLISGNTIFRVGLELDGVPIGQANYTGEEPLPAVIVAIPSVSPGEHTLTAVWSTASGTLVQWSDVYQAEMNLVVLQSVPSFDRAFISTLAPNVGPTSIGTTQSTPTPMGFTPLTVDVPAAAQPALISLMANDINGDRLATRFLIDGVGVAGSVMAYDMNRQQVRSLSPTALAMLTPGEHTLDAEWFRITPANVMTTRGSHGLPSSCRGSRCASRSGSTRSSPRTSSPSFGRDVDASFQRAGVPRRRARGSSAWA